MSRSNRFNDFIERNPGTEEYIVNAEFVMKQIDKALDGHTHSGTDSPLIDQSVTLDFATHGGTIYVKTPAASSSQGELPDTSGLGDTYTKTTIDSKLAGKSDAGHTHVVSNITDFPTAIKNPQPLTINGQSYDGSSAMALNISTSEYVDDLITNLGNNVLSAIFERAYVNHTHFAIDIFMCDENKNLQDVIDTINNETQELGNKITNENTKLENLITKEVSRLESLITSEISRLELILNNQKEES